MRASPQLLILETAIGLFEQRMESEPTAPLADLLLLGQQLHRLNRIYIGLVETALGAAAQDAARRDQADD